MDKRRYSPLLRVAGTLMLWLSLLHVPLVEAHNGAMAIAVPVEGIVVDGDLSDWPEDMRRYPIALPEYGIRPKDGEDFEGSFQIGYNAKENALHVGVEVSDESTELDTTGNLSWWGTQDGCEVYVDVRHKKDSLAVQQYRIYGEEGDLYRVMKREGGYQWFVDIQYRIYGEKGDLYGVVKREGARHRYEWRLDIGKMTGGKVHLHSRMVLGFDVVVSDKDKDGPFSWMAWGRGVDKVSNTDGQGDVVLVHEDTEMGTIRGKIQWADGEPVVWDWRWCESVWSFGTLRGIWAAVCDLHHTERAGGQSGGVHTGGSGGESVVWDVWGGRKSV